RAVVARVRHAGRVEVDGRAVARDRHPRLLHHEPHVVFGHRVEHAGDPSTVFSHKRHAGVGWIGVTSGFGDFGQAHAVVVRMSRARIFRWKMWTGSFASSATRIAKRSSFSCSNPSLPMCDV